MYKPTDPIANLKGVGQRAENYLKTANIKKIGDLLNYFPFRYEDLSQINLVEDVLQKNFKSTEENKGKVVLKGSFKQISAFVTRTKKSIVKAKFYDETGVIDVMWFNSLYIKSQLNEQNTYLLTAKPSEYKGKINFINPTIDLSNKQSVNTGKIIPIYININGISLRTLRKLITEALQNTNIEDFLQIKNNLELLDLKKAYTNLHFPTSFKLVEQAKDRIALNELIHIKLHGKKLEQINKKHKSNFLLKTSFFDEFKSKLPYSLTKDQNVAITKIEELMKEEVPTNVLVSGDVGSGKTVVAMASSYNTVKNKGKVIYIAPTVVLAEQVYYEFCKYFNNSQIKLITSKTSKSLKKTKINSKLNTELKFSESILIGTHALLNLPNIEKFANLVIIDEQHKFGVKQRAKLIENANKVRPHVITMTATPIPRSLALTYFTELKVIPIKTKPIGRIKITTKVLNDKRKSECLKWIKNKVIKETKAYYIVPFIEKSKSPLFEDVKNITEKQVELKKYFGEKNVYVLHGKLKDEEKTKIIDEFKKVTGGILLSTQVVEVGVDIKDATVIIIESAERFGLASLHQLRGRVGRSNLKSYCFLVPSTTSTNENTRLKNLEKEDNGFKLSLLDLKTRGSGEIFGIRQSGELDLKFVDFSNTKLITTAQKIAEKIYTNKTDLQKYKDNFFTRDFFEIKDN